jgi:hypothetical protein
VATIALIASAVVWVAILLALVMNLSGRRPRGPQFRWKGAGLLLIMTAGLFSAFADYRKWPPSQLHAVAKLDLLLILAAIPCLLAWSKSRRRAGPHGPR